MSAQPQEPSVARHGFLTWAKNRWAWVAKQKAFLWVFGGLASFLLSTLVIIPIWNWLAGPDTYIVYLVGDFSDPSTGELRAGFEDAQKDLQINHVNIRFVSRNAKEKEAAEVSAKLAENNDTLMVIGHLNTTASASALPNYLNADPPIPVILAIETNPELLPADRSKYYPVFRLSPTDDKQAERAAGFIVGNEANGIWVVEDDTANPIYTRYLAREFVRQVEMKAESQAAEVERNAGLFLDSRLSEEAGSRAVARQ